MDREDINFELRLIKLVNKRSKAGDSLSDISKLCKLPTAKVLDYLSRSTNLTPKDLEIIFSLKSKGLSLDEISDEFSIDLALLQSFLPDTELTLEKKHSILVMSRKGRPNSSISKFLGIRKEAVENYLSKCDCSSDEDSVGLAGATESKSKAKTQAPASKGIKGNRSGEELPKVIYSFFNSSTLLYRTNMLIGDLYCLRLSSFFFKPLCSLTELPDAKLFITGGGHPFGSSDVHCIDIKRDFSVCTKLSLSTPRRYHVSLNHAGFVYVIGGNNNHYLNLCERYIISQNRWEFLLPLPFACNGLSAVLLESSNSIYTLGGHCSSRLDRIQRLCLESLAWDLIEVKLPYPSFNIACFKLSDDADKFYFVMNRELHSFTPSTSSFQHVRTLVADIESFNGCGYYRRGYLYCLSSIGPAKSLFIGKL